MARSLDWEALSPDLVLSALKALGERLPAHAGDPQPSARCCSSSGHGSALEGSPTCSAPTATSVIIGEAVHIPGRGRRVLAEVETPLLDGAECTGREGVPPPRAQSRA